MARRVLFVCLGNICRSPTAEAIFRRTVEDAGLAADFEIDSAGTGDWHVGEQADPRMRKAAKARGYELLGRARQVSVTDLARFDHILAMDGDNLASLMRMATLEQRDKLKLLRDYDPEGRGEDVPDPYYGGPEGFSRVIDIVERSCRGLLSALGDEAG